MTRQHRRTTRWRLGFVGYHLLSLAALSAVLWLVLVWCALLVG